ncbi:hypothetical protein ACFE04_001169 [Oxalis oulophora]
MAHLRRPTRRLLGSLPLHRHSHSTAFNNQTPKNRWTVKQVTKSNYNTTLDEFNTHITNSDFIAISLKNTGSHSATWHRVSPFDTPDTAYLKAKYAAERFQILQFAICPFTVTDTKVTAYPYNFHLFPRDELKIGMPSYAFSCQTSYLSSMAREGFDFNACIYDGISYLSTAQESSARNRIGNPTSRNNLMKSSSSSPTVADTIFIERVKSRVKNWKRACKDSSSVTDKDEVFIRSLRNLVLGSEEYNSRPSMTVDVCSERQVQLVLELLGELSDELVPLVIPSKGGGVQAVRVILTSSKEDKILLKSELQNLENEQNKKLRGFREVIDLISASQKPIVSCNSLNDFAIIHSKFIAPLPPNMDEFMFSLHMAFPCVLDVNHLIKEIGPLRKVTNISGAMSYLKNHFFSPIDVEIPPQDEGKIHGQNAVKMCHLFAKLCSVLKISPQASTLERFVNIFYPCSSEQQEDTDGTISVWTNSTRKVRCEDLVFLWGFNDKMSAKTLKSLLQGSHQVFSENFDVRFVDKSCAILVFWKPGVSSTFLDMMNSEEISGNLKEMVSEGVRVAGYEMYKKACCFGLWEQDLADSLDKALSEDLNCQLEDRFRKTPSEIYWCSESSFSRAEGDDAHSHCWVDGQDINKKLHSFYSCILSSTNVVMYSDFRDSLFVWSKLRSVSHKGCSYGIVSKEGWMDGVHMAGLGHW